MTSVRGRNRARDFEDLVQSGAEDLDPEEDHYSSDGESHSSSTEEREDNARQHYVDVGKSKLRKPASVALGPQYQGSRVARGEIEAEDDGDDPFDKGFEDLESDSGREDGIIDHSSSASDAENDEASERSETSNTDLSEVEHAAVPSKKVYEDDHRKLRDAMKAELHGNGTASILKANKEDAEKGRAVTKQRNTFNSLLNARMKLQKGLIATNTLVGTSVEQVQAEIREADDALAAAESAALSLWRSLNNLREDLIASRSDKKRKRAAFVDSTPTTDLWRHMQDQESESRSYRDVTLQKWSKKAQGPAKVSDSNLLKSGHQQTQVVDIIREQLSNTERLVKRTRHPRSCAPLQASQRISEDVSIYDDADFYGLLLKELLEQKGNDAVAASNVDVSWQIRRDNKTKKNVDTKASKGRKLRYTVHEKLQNFMAPEDRSTWGDRQSDELFGSLFGQRLGLGEQEVDGSTDDEIDPEEAGLMMFRS